MPLSEPQQQFLENWMRSKAIVQCPLCGDAQWQFAQAAYLRALLEEGEPDMSEEKGVVKAGCGNCGYLVLFDAETVSIRGFMGERKGALGLGNSNSTTSIISREDTLAAI